LGKSRSGAAILYQTPYFPSPQDLVETVYRTCVLSPKKTIASSIPKRLSAIGSNNGGVMQDLTVIGAVIERFRPKQFSYVPICQQVWVLTSDTGKKAKGLK
jgi:hypothetical protein